MSADQQESQNEMPQTMFPAFSRAYPRRADAEFGPLDALAVCDCEGVRVFAGR